MPSIYLLWKRYQATLLDQLEKNGEDLIIGGDGRHDSMGHSAKYGAYTVFCCNNSKIIDFALVQVSMFAYTTSRGEQAQLEPGGREQLQPISTDQVGMFNFVAKETIGVVQALS